MGKADECFIGKHECLDIMPHTQSEAHKREYEGEKDNNILCKELKASLSSKAEDHGEISLLHLPEEVLLRVLGHLSSPNLLSMAKTCQTFKRIVKDHTLIKQDNQTIHMIFSFSINLTLQLLDVPIHTLSPESIAKML